MKTRIYVVDSDLDVRLIRARTRGEALSFAVKTTFKVRPASQDDLVEFIADGIEVETIYNPDQTELDLAE